MEKYVTCKGAFGLGKWKLVDGRGLETHVYIYKEKATQRSV